MWISTQITDFSSGTVSLCYYPTTKSLMHRGGSYHKTASATTQSIHMDEK